jgi:surface antigen
MAMNPIRPLAILVAASLCGGCVVSGGGIEDAVDEKAVTAAIAPSAPAATPDQASDQMTVRNAVSAADLSATEGQRPWANADTGATGVITAIAESRAGDTICRTFQTSRQRFDGIALYNGEACTKGGGQWTLTHFAEGQ